MNTEKADQAKPKTFKTGDAEKAEKSEKTDLKDNTNKRFWFNPCSSDLIRVPKSFAFCLIRFFRLFRFFRVR